MNEGSLILTGSCTGCGRTLLWAAGQKGRRWCSGGCRSSWNYRRKLAAEWPASRVYFGQCQECQAPWASATINTKYCSVECRGNYFRKLRHVNGDSRKYVQRRRARIRNAASEPIERRIVADRDGWMCGICHDPIDPELVYPHRRSLSIDHITPLALGGDHLYMNVRAAHWDCNVLRGATLDIDQDTDMRTTSV